MEELVLTCSGNMEAFNVPCGKVWEYFQRFCFEPTKYDIKENGLNKIVTIYGTEQKEFALRRLMSNRDDGIVSVLYSYGIFVSDMRHKTLGFEEFRKMKLE